jgi:hypothetical protein
MKNIFNTFKQFIMKFTKKTLRTSLSVLVGLIMIIVAFTTIGLVEAYANEDYKTNISFDQNQVMPLVITDKKTEIQPGLARIDIDKLNNDRDPEAIKAFIQQIAPEYGVDWKLVYAIGAYESGYFKSNLALSNNNFFGRKATSTTWRSYSTAEEGIRDQFLYVKEHYIDNGLDTPAKMNHIYCEGNTWQVMVQTIMDKA